MKQDLSWFDDAYAKLPGPQGSRNSIVSSSHLIGMLGCRWTLHVLPYVYFGNLTLSSYLYNDYFTHGSISPTPFIYKYDINFFLPLTIVEDYKVLGHKLRIAAARISDVHPDRKHPSTSGKVLDAQIIAE